MHGGAPQRLFSRKRTHQDLKAQTATWTGQTHTPTTVQFRTKGPVMAVWTRRGLFDIYIHEGVGMHPFLLISMSIFVSADTDPIKTNCSKSPAKAWLIVKKRLSTILWKTVSNLRSLHTGNKFARQTVCQILKPTEVHETEMYCRKMPSGEKASPGPLTNQRTLACGPFKSVTNVMLINLVWYFNLTIVLLRCNIKAPSPHSLSKF